MKLSCPILMLCFGLVTAHAVGADGWLDELGGQLSFTSADGAVRAKLGGSWELEGYAISKPVADLIFTEHDFLFNPRLILFGDVQIGQRAYFFAQLRADRGFDPSEDSLQMRLDEYALRVELGRPGRLNVQVGKFATVVGNWVARHDAWNNPFITAPLLYDNLTGLWDLKAAPSVNKLLEWAHVRPASSGAGVYVDKYLRVPVIWGPVYAQGVALTGAWGRLTYAAELKNTGLSARPGEWRQADWAWSHPNFGARLGFRPNEMWELGLSVSEGDYLNHAAGSFLPPGRNLHDYRQRVVAQDLRFAWHRFQLWAETSAARFEIPGVANVGTFAYYVEAKYKFTPQFSGAVRWNQQFFDEVRNSAGESVAWGRQVWRIEVAPAYRFSAHTQLKLQYSLRHDDPSPEEFTHEFAAQFMIRF